MKKPKTLINLDVQRVKELVFANNNKAEINIARLRKKGEEDEEKDSADFEDINRIPDSKLFKLETIPVSSKVTSLAVADMNGAGHRLLRGYRRPVCTVSEKGRRLRTA